jgi:gluconokinase
MESLILTVDIGTTNIKAGIIDPEGNILRAKTSELEIERDETGKAEHNPEKLFSNFISICHDVLNSYEDKIALLVLSSYQFGLIPLDKDFRPLTGLITLLDIRPRETFNELARKLDFEELYRRTGAPPLFISPFAKIYWLKRKRKEIFENARYFLSSKDYLLLRLLGKPYTEPSIASATQLMNINHLKWDAYPLDILGIAEKNLPEIVPSEEIIGKMSPEVRESLGLKRDVYVLPGVYDGGAIGLGIGAMGDSVGVMNIGTTAMLRIAYPKPVIDKDKRMRFQSYYLCSNKWFIGGAINNAGVVLKWFRDNIFDLPYDELTSLAEKVQSPDLFFLPFITGERYPEIGNIVSGVFWGLRSYHTKSHMIRAGMEGVAFTLRMAFDALKENEIEIKELRAGGGGTKSPLWMRIFSSVFNMPIKITECDEPALLGSAQLGFYALNIFKSLREARERLVKVKEIYYPEKETLEYYERRYEFFKFLLKSLKNAFRKHSKL